MGINEHEQRYSSFGLGRRNISTREIDKQGGRYQQSDSILILLPVNREDDKREESQQETRNYIFLRVAHDRPVARVSQ